MPFSYLNAKRQAALRLAQIKGSDQATLEAAYSGAWASALDGAEIPKTGFKDLMMMVAKELAQIIGSNANHPARTFLYGRSVDLANLASTPSVDNTGAEFVGVFDSVADSSTSAPLTLQPTQTLADVSNTFFSDTDLYYYNLTGNQIRHTRTAAYLQGCVWNETAQEALYDSDGQCPLPEVCANMLVQGMIANAAQVGWTDGAGGYRAGVFEAYGTMYQQSLHLLSTGTPNIPLASQANQAAG